MLAVIQPFMIPLAAAVIGLDYLRRNLLPSAPQTESGKDPYTPPFAGGQCSGVTYFVSLGANIRNDDGSLYTTKPYGYVGAFVGKIQRVYIDTSSGDFNITVVSASGSQVVFGVGGKTKGELFNVVVEGSPNNCGDVPNPVNTPISSDGLANSTAPLIDSGTPLVQGAPLVVIPSIGAALSALVAAIAAAANALDAAKNLMDALKAIADMLDKIKDWLDDKDKDDDSKKELHRYDYGSIRRDGFLRLYPNGEIEGFKPTYIDLQLLSIPIGYGKYFGELSPNFYRFKSLGHISFVSPTFGILETKEIEFSRTSMNVPENSYGFFYHIGLEDAIRANVSLFYLQAPPPEEEES